MGGPIFGSICQCTETIVLLMKKINYECLWVDYCCKVYDVK